MVTDFLRHLDVVQRITVVVIHRKLGGVIGLGEDVQPVVQISCCILKGCR